MAVILKFLVAGLVRYWLIHLDYWQTISNRVEIATPLNSWKRLVEGVYLYDRNINPYDGDSFHESPIILVFFHCLMKKVPYLLPLIFTVLDLLTAYLLYKTSKSFIRLFKQSQDMHVSKTADESKTMLLNDTQLDEASEYVLSVYLFNPYSVLNCAGMTTTVIQNLLVATSLWGASNGYRVLACVFVALATHQALYPVLLIVPIAILLADVNKGCNKCSYIRTLLVFVLCWGFLIYISAYIMDGSYQYVNNTYGFILTVPDLKPNIGLFWYFFTEMFEHFRVLFVCAFQINALALYVVPLTLRFKKEPVLLATVLIALSTIFRSYPCIGDVGFYLALLPMWKHLFTFMQQKFIVGCAFIITSALGPTVWHLWIYSGSANANFFFGVTLSFATAQIFLITDLLFAYIKREFTLKHGSSRQVDGKPAKLVLRYVRLDGIEESINAVETEFVLPFRAGGFQFHRYQIFMDLFLPTQNLLEVDNILPLSEKCLLHRMMSSSVRQWERGDEINVCPLSAQQRQNMATQGSGRIHSRCPIEEGVIQTDWGPVAPGILVAAVAASLESQRVLVSEILDTDIFKEGISEPLMASAKQEWYEDIEAFNAKEEPAAADISNIWVATLAGDLAEVVVNQGSRVGSAPHTVVVGSSNRWNDTLLPRDFYLLPRNASNVDWQFTDAEILAGVDGLILANYISKWNEQRRTLRLSQILDMYYSHEGVSFDPNVKACNRQALFNQFFTSSVLLTEASRFARVLALRQITAYIPSEDMDRITQAAVSAFVSYVPNVLSQNHLDCHASTSVPVIDMVVATDGAWRQYDVEQFMSWLGGALEINMQRSSLALLHGNTGEWIVPPSNNLTAVFDYISNYTDPWPNRLNLPKIISRSIRLSREKALEEVELLASAGPSTMMLIVSPSDRPSGTELQRATELMLSLRTSFFDVYFAYAARDLTDFLNINTEYLDYSELFLSISSTAVTSVIEAVDTLVVKSEIPTRIFGPHCPFNGSSFDQGEYEDFVLPNRKVTYRIHLFHLRQQPLINIHIRNDGQGELLVCSWRGADAARSCRTVPERESHVFNITDPCPSIDFCPPAYYSVAATTSGNICAHDDCRLPHQVGIYSTVRIKMFTSA